jgi:crotonobetainyl-CoA:carnitine CoA-transferase CaiB-like acyl-CoA transferase
VSGRAAAPLEGRRFLEVGDDPAAAYAGRLLVLLGAEVVRIAEGTPARDRGAPRAWLDGVKHIEPAHDAPTGAGWRAVAGGLRWDGALDTTGHLGGVGCPVVRVLPTASPGEDWAQSGAAALTGSPESGPLVPPGWLATAMRGAGATFELLAAVRGVRCPLDGAALLGERAALAGLAGLAGPVSASGWSHLVAAGDGWLAVSLARPSDFELVAAWLEAGDPGRALSPPQLDAWLGARVGQRSVSGLVERARLLGLPVAAVGPPSGGADEQLIARGQPWPPAPWLLDGRVPDAVRGALRAPAPGPDGAGSPGPSVPRVVDLSALWAGPLASSLLVAAGCQVVKIEDPGRPDTTRTWSPPFFDLLNAGKQSVAVPFVGGGVLAELIASADVVVEASRPRAMEQLGIEPGTHQLWASITGYGRQGPWREGVALGDDAAAAGGLVVRAAPGAPPWFCADAAGDPVTGLHAAVAVLAAIVGGATGTIDLAMREVVGHALGPVPVSGQWPPGEPAGPLALAPPRARRPWGRAPELGRDTASVLASL